MKRKAAAVLAVAAALSMMISCGNTESGGSDQPASKTSLFRSYSIEYDFFEDDERPEDSVVESLVKTAGEQLKAIKNGDGEAFKKAVDGELFEKAGADFYEEELESFLSDGMSGFKEETGYSLIENIDIDEKPDKVHVLSYFTDENDDSESIGMTALLLSYLNKDGSGNGVYCEFMGFTYGSKSTGIVVRYLDQAAYDEEYGNYQEKKALKEANINAKRAYNAVAEYAASQEVTGIMFTAPNKEYDLNSEGTDELSELIYHVFSSFDENIGGKVYVGTANINGSDTFYVQWKSDLDPDTIGQYPSAVTWDKHDQAEWKIFLE